MDEMNPTCIYMNNANSAGNRIAGNQDQEYCLNRVGNAMGPQAAVLCLLNQKSNNSPLPLLCI